MHGLYYTISHHWLLMPSGTGPHTQKQTYTNFPHRANIKKPGELVFSQARLIQEEWDSITN